QNGRPLGVAEVAIRPRILDASVGAATRTVRISVAIVFGLLALALAFLVRGASARLGRQNNAFQSRTRDLLESTQLLEKSLLQTVETLNAAVEARDPYTAGHSQRVRRVALAVGRTLGLSSKRLGTLGTAALFHDVGKIGIPDSILTKAGRWSRSRQRSCGSTSLVVPRSSRRCRRSRTPCPPSGTTTSAGTAWGTRTGSAGRRSRSRPRSSGLPMPGTR
ncbi:MAG: HD domain-containing protein, partial [Actinobacteria bacterium]|nr:HD domain-containing protein [Actinomycetota bacterium]